MKEIDEGGQSLLDNSMLLLCSNLFDGDAHSADQMPMLLAGRGGGTLKPGRVLDYLDKGDDNRRACSLYLSTDGQDGREAGPLRRYRQATGRSVSFVLTSKRYSAEAFVASVFISGSLLIRRGEPAYS